MVLVLQENDNCALYSHQRPSEKRKHDNNHHIESHHRHIENIAWECATADLLAQALFAAVVRRCRQFQCAGSRQRFVGIYDGGSL